MTAMFSVSTTSSKKPEAIRAEVERVLQVRPLARAPGRGGCRVTGPATCPSLPCVRWQNNCIKYKENGYTFLCSHTSSIVPSAPKNAEPDGITLPSGDVEFEVAVVKVRRALPAARRHESAPADVLAALLSPLLRRQVSMMNLYGILTKRYSGDAWQYRSVCQKILDDLRI